MLASWSGKGAPLVQPWPIKCLSIYCNDPMVRVYACCACVYARLVLAKSTLSAYHQCPHHSVGNDPGKLDPAPVAAEDP